MRLMTATSCMLLMLFVTSVTNAQDAKCTKCKSETAVCTAEDGKACSQCPVEMAMAKLPKMTFKVGTESTCCDQAAAALAKKHDKPIEYVVGDKTYPKMENAYVALVESTEKYVDGFVSPKTCSVSNTTTVAGKTCKCSVEAGKRAELVKAAITDVKMTYKVGKETTCCSKSAAALAEKSGEKTTFVVAEKEYCCNYEARLNLAKAKYAAAVKAVAATAPAKKTETSAEAKGDS